MVAAARLGAGFARRHSKNLPMDDVVASNAETLWAFHNIATSSPGPADLVIGLGSYLLAVADRAAELVARGVAPRLLFCGGQGNWTRDRWTSTEAERFRERAIQCGVAPDVIDVETRSTNIGENLSCARSLVEARMPNVKRVVIVTKANTTRRAALTKAVVWPELEAQYGAPALHWTRQAVAPLGTADTICEMVGDLARIIEYPALGYQAPIDIPPTVRDAYRVLVDAGYTAHLPR
jgi:uncharacterized SAM-binding protein YcdF (DUF218 family)